MIAQGVHFINIVQRFKNDKKRSTFLFLLKLFVLTLISIIEYLHLQYKFFSNNQISSHIYM